MTTKNFTPLGSGSVSRPRETEPAALSKEDYDFKEVVEHEPDEEIKPFVNPRAETISLPPDLKKLGLQPATPAQFPGYQNVKLPISDDKVILGMHQPVTSSFRWLATLAIYILSKAHLVLKFVHGKTIRVFKR